MKNTLIVASMTFLLVVGNFSHATEVDNFVRQQLLNYSLQNLSFSGITAEVRNLIPIIDAYQGTLGLGIQGTGVVLEKIGVLPKNELLSQFPKGSIFYVSDDQGKEWLKSCVVDVYQSEKAPHRIFLRNRSCSVERPLAKYVLSGKSLEFAVIIDVDENLKPVSMKSASVAALTSNQNVIEELISGKK